MAVSSSCFDVISFSLVPDSWLYCYVTILCISPSGPFLVQQLLISSRNLEFFTNGYRYLIQIVPAAVVAPMYFSGKIEFGVINQSVSAFSHILGDVSLVVYQFQAISAFSAVIDRLGMVIPLSLYLFIILLGSIAFLQRLQL